MEKKMTKVEMYNAIVEVISTVEGTEELVAFLNEESARIDARNKNKKPSKATLEKRAENASALESIKATLYDAAEPMTIDELKEAISAIELFSPQRVSALMKDSVAEGTIVKSMKKVDKARKTAYAMA